MKGELSSRDWSLVDKLVHWDEEPGALDLRGKLTARMGEKASGFRGNPVPNRPLRGSPDTWTKSKAGSKGVDPRGFHILHSPCSACLWLTRDQCLKEACEPNTD